MGKLVFILVVPILVALQLSYEHYGKKIRRLVAHGLMLFNLAKALSEGNATRGLTINWGRVLESSSKGVGVTFRKIKLSTGRFMLRVYGSKLKQTFLPVRSGWQKGALLIKYDPLECSF